MAGSQGEQGGSPSKSVNLFRPASVVAPERIRIADLPVLWGSAPLWADSRCYPCLPFPMVSRTSTVAVDKDLVGGELLDRQRRSPLSMDPSEPESEAEGEEPSITPSLSPSEFEEQIRRLLGTIGLTDVSGGATFVLGGHQVDACGGIENRLLVFDCTVKKGSRGTTKRVTTKIEQWRGKYATLLEGVRKHPVYSRYDSLSVVIAANAPVADNDVSYGLASDPKIAVLGRAKIDYLSEVANDIGPYAKFRLASMLGLEIRRRQEVVPALRLTDKTKESYVLAVDSRNLAELAFVPQAEAGFKLFYQRLIKKAKIRAISEYVQGTERPFPNSVILAVDSPLRFEPLESHSAKGSPNEVTFGRLHLPETYGSCWVVDGQHRIYGSALGTRPTNLVATLLPATNLEKARYFLDINSNQTKIDSDLKWDLRAVLVPDDAEGRISAACQELNRLDGPLHEKVRIPHLGVIRNRPIKLSGLCDAVLKNRVHETHQYDATDPAFVKLMSSDLNSWLVQIDESVGDPIIKRAFLFDNSGLSVLVILFKRIAKRLDHDRPSLSVLIRYAQAMSEWILQLDPAEGSRLAKRCSSEAGRHEVADQAVAFMNERLPVDSQLEIAGSATRLSDEIIAFEGAVRAQIDTLFSREISPTWVRDAALGSARPIRTANDLTLGQVLSLVGRDEYWKRLKPGFDQHNVPKEFAISQLQYLVAYRNAHAHARTSDSRRFDESLVEASLRNLRKCFGLPSSG